MRIVCDIEADSLTPTKIWLIVTKDIDNGEIRIFRRPDTDPVVKRELYEHFAKATLVVGHYWIAFDYWLVVRKFFPGLIRDVRIICDTVVASRLFRYDVLGGHSLAAWANRFGKTKPPIEDFGQGLTPAMENRCVQDVELNFELYKFLEKHINSEVYKKALEIEHRMAFVCVDMEETGFHFNVEEAKRLQQEIDNELRILDNLIQESFLPKSVLIREVTPKRTKSGALSRSSFGFLGGGIRDLSPYSDGHTFSLIEFQPFNPASPPQIVARLNEAGWKPFNKTKGHISCEMSLKRCRNKEERKALNERLIQYKATGWKVDEDNLSTLPEDAPEGARKLAERIVLASRRSVLQEWLNAYNPTTGRIHGKFNGIGAWTGRMSHQQPNQGNIPSDPDVKDKDKPSPVERWKLKYSRSLRALWGVPKKKRLVGVDADQIQLRVFGHYIEDEKFTRALVEGDKEKGTDVHSLNGKILGRDRGVGKTFIYSFLLGVGVDKASSILHTNSKDARTKIDTFIAAYPGLAALKANQIPKDAERGYFIGLDGRLVPVPSEHHVLAGYLQNGEALIMKYACVDKDIGWRVKLKQEKINFDLVDFVHDEWQTEIDDDDELAAYVGKVQCQSIVDAGKLLGLKVPTAGAISYHDGRVGGYTWAETH